MTKIAVVTDDRQTISAHFGRAQYYLVYTIQDGKVTQRELRDKANHSHFAGEHHEHHDQHGKQPHGTDPASQVRHASMMDTIMDCQVLLARGMGWGAQAALKERGVRAILTDIQDAEAAIEVYLAGELVDHPERLH